MKILSLFDVLIMIIYCNQARKADKEKDEKKAENLKKEAERKAITEKSDMVQRVLQEKEAEEAAENAGKVNVIIFVTPLSGCLQNFRKSRYPFGRPHRQTTTEVWLRFAHYPP